MSPTLRSELARLLPIMEAKAKPMGEPALFAKLIAMAPTFGIPAHRSSEEWAAMFDTYLDALAPLSAEMLDEAFLRWNRAELYPKDPGRHAFYPKPAELFALAEPSRLEIGKALYRARRAMEQSAKAPVPQPSQQERSGRRQQLIDAGLMTADGHVILSPPKMPDERRSVRETPAQMAERLRNHEA